MIRFYFHPTPNPAKVALFLEEAGLDYELIPVDTSKGEQHLPAFRAINPNGKVPAIDDGGVFVFDNTGKHLGTIATGVPTANCGWGDDGSTLYITADKHLVRVKTKTKGAGW